MKLCGLIGKSRGGLVFCFINYGYLSHADGFFQCDLKFRLSCNVIRPNDSSTLVSLTCGGLSGIASSTCKSLHNKLSSLD